MFILTAASDRQGVAEAMVGITERNRRINNRQKSTDELWNRDGVRTAGEDDIDFDTHAGISAKCNECKKVSNKNDDVICCSQCPLSFHVSCLKKLYHIVVEDLNEHLVCPRCKKLRPERYNSDGSEYSDSED